MTEKATPTITLAELYENQDQYIDALVIYKNLNKENPSEELQNKIAELNDKIFKENTLEYSTVIDKIFTEEEKRLFHILPHDQYKAYKESQADLKNDETYPEELTAIKDEIAPEEKINLEIEVENAEEEIVEIESTLDNDSPIEEPIEESIEEQEEDQIAETNDLESLEVDDDDKPEKEIIPEEVINLEIEDETSEIDNSGELEVENEEEIVELESKIDIDPPIEESIEEQIEEQIAKANDLESLEVDDEDKPKKIIAKEEADNTDDTLEKDIQLEDDISLEIDDTIPDKIEKTEAIIENDTSTDDVTSIEEIMKKKADVQNEIIENEENELENDPVDELETIIDSEDDNHILELLTSLSKMRPDIVERVIKENFGSGASLAEIKLSDLHYVVELLKVSENVERD